MASARRKKSPPAKAKESLTGQINKLLAETVTFPRRSPVASICIIKLFGDRDVRIEFDSPVTILVADNGSGKTTILSIIYAVLSRQFHRLRKYVFESIIVETHSGNKITVTPEMANVGAALAKLEPRFGRLLRNFSENEIVRVIDQAYTLPPAEFLKSPAILQLSEMTGFPPGYLYNIFHSELAGGEGQKQLNLLTQDNVRGRLLESFPYRSLYFPTYRRIEEEMEELGYTEKEGMKTEGLIRFGMSDVTQRIKEITGKIEKSSVEWYSRISGQMLSQLVDGITVNESTMTSIKDQNALRIVLDRLGANISGGQKQRIMELVSSNVIASEKYLTLAYFLSNLIKVYDQQREYDTAIKEFTRVCNKYLIDKEVVYDEIRVELQIVEKFNNTPVQLARLSSGEKQIVSLFSQIFLESNAELAVLFDEPELSLSIEWQKMLLPDIINSGRCRFLLATTHSPFVFHNELDIRAYDLSKFVRRVNG